MPEGADDALGQLCRELGLAGCPGEKTRVTLTPAEGKLLSEYKRGPLPRPSSMFGIDPRVRLADLDARQRKELCAWRSMEGMPAAGLEFLESGRTIQFQTFEECVHRFPSCDHRLGDVRASASYLA